MRAMSESVHALQKSLGFDVLRDAQKLAIGHVMTDAQWLALGSIARDALPKIDVSAIMGPVAWGYEPQEPGLSAEWLAAESERRWAVVETRDAIYALYEEVEAARADAGAARQEVRAAGRRNLWLTIAVLALGVPGAIVAADALIALL